MSLETRQRVASEVAEALRAGNACAKLRALCAKYNEEELHIALDNISPVHTAYHDVVNGAITGLRHREIEKRLKALEKPHWTLVPTFWAVIGTMIIGVVGIIIACFAWRDPLPPVEDKLLSQVLPPHLSTQPVQQSPPPKPTEIHTNSVVTPASPKK